MSDEEYWFECQDCEGSGSVNVPDGLDESSNVILTCPVCNGSGVVEGDEDDLGSGWKRVR